MTVVALVLLVAAVVLAAVGVVTLLGARREAARTRLAADERERLEEQVAQAQRMETVGRLAGGFAHDFNNLLARILGHTQLALADATGEQRDRLQRIEVAASQAAGLTDQLLALGRRQLLRPEVLDLAAVVEQLVDVVRSSVGADVELVLGPHPADATVLVDRGGIEQVLVNLVLNARDALPRGGRIQIAVRRAGDRVLLDVSDNGEGMTADVAARAFEPFFTTKPKGQGSGLGLAVVHGLVTQSGGSISVDSRVDEGTTFRVALPFAPRPAYVRPASGLDRAAPDRPGRPAVGSAAAGARPGAPGEPAGRSTGGSEPGRLVLVVDDDDDVRLLAAHQLEAGGFQVVDFPTAEQALEAVARGLSVDLAVCDIVLPGRRGTDLARLLRQQFPGLPVVFVSGYPDDVLAEMGVSGLPVVRKPFPSGRLVQAVGSALVAR